MEKLQKEIEPFVEAVSASIEESPSSPAPAPPPEVDDFASLLTPAVKSSDHSAVSLVDVRIYPLLSCSSPNQNIGSVF